MSRFFEIRQNEALYRQGICGKKILIVGASVPCDFTECSLYNKCTSVQAINPSTLCEMDNSYTVGGYPSYHVDNYIQNGEYPTQISQNNDNGWYTYYVWTDFFDDCIQAEHDLHKIWDYVAFTEYVQRYLTHLETKRSDVSATDDEVFLGNLSALSPDVVIVWGEPTRDRIKKMKGFRMMENTGYYCGTFTKGSAADKEIVVVFADHPSSPAFNNHYDELKKELKTVLGLV